MRKILTFLSIMATLVLFVACGNSKPAEGEQKKDGGEKQVAQSNIFSDCVLPALASFKGPFKRKF